MSFSQALASGVSGILAHQARLDNIGNNLANINTIGFRRGHVQFGDLFSQTLSSGSGPAGNRGGVNPIQIGLGVRVAGVTQDFTQGGLETTGRASDMAIEGNGFFIVSTATQTFYTRDGSFTLDPLNRLVNSAGLFVQGTNRDPVTGVVADPSQSTLEDLQVPLGSVGGVRETENISFVGNLNAAGDVATTGTRMQSALIFERVADGADPLLAASTGAGNVLTVPTAADAGRVVAGDTVFLSGTGINEGLYTVTASNAVAGTITVGQTIAVGLTGVTVHVPATAATDLRPTTPGGAAGTIGGAYDQDGVLLLANHSAEVMPFIDVAGTLGDRAINERFFYGDVTVPTGDPATEFNGMTVGDLVSFLEDVFGINAANDPGNDRPEIPNSIPVGLGGDEGVFDGDPMNEARAIFGRTSTLASTVAVSGTGSLSTSTGGTVGSVLTASAGTPFLGLTAGNSILLSGTGVVEGFYTVSAVDAAGTWVQLGDATGTVDDSAGASGLTGVSWDLAPNRIYINGNLGEDNAIGSLRFSSGSADIRPFENGVIADANGESATTTVTVYDSTGSAHLMDVTAVLVNRTSDEATWRWYAQSGDDTTLTESPNPFSPPGPPTIVSGSRTDRAVGWGDIVFDRNGLFVRDETDASGSARAINIDREDNATDPNLSVTPDFSGMTQFAADSSLLDLGAQDGFPPGTLQSFAVSQDGTVLGVFSNGVTQSMGTVALADFSNVQGLVTEGGNLFREGANSGTARIGRPQDGGLGLVRGGTLELSNVDLAREFTELIVTQRGFQANARTISAADELLTDLMRIL